jgi:hypothetical protein
VKNKEITLKDGTNTIICKAEGGYPSPNCGLWIGAQALLDDNGNTVEEFDCQGSRKSDET